MPYGNALWRADGDIKLRIVIGVGNLVPVSKLKHVLFWCFYTEYGLASLIAPIPRYQIAGDCDRYGPPFRAASAVEIYKINLFWERVVMYLKLSGAGSIEVDVFDLADKSQPLLMSYSFSPAQARQYWRAGGLANHYNITCPWKDALPSGNEITVRVKFIDYLTGQSFTATKQCRIRLPGSNQQIPVE